MATRKDKIRTERRAARVRNAQHRGVNPRVSVFRSLSHIYGQIIDDVTMKTVASSSSLVLENVSGDKKSVARAVGKDLAARAKEKGINKVIFDRGPFAYHGRVQAFVEGLREGGMQI